MAGGRRALLVTTLRRVRRLNDLSIEGKRRFCYKSTPPGGAHARAFTIFGPATSILLLLPGYIHPSRRKQALVFRPLNGAYTARAFRMPLPALWRLALPYRTGARRTYIFIPFLFSVNNLLFALPFKTSIAPKPNIRRAPKAGQQK